MKTAELTGTALDWAVAKAEGAEVKKNPHRFDDSLIIKGPKDRFWRTFAEYSPSTDWAEGGPIIERENIQLTPNEDTETWAAGFMFKQGCEDCFGPTPLVAAMRCYCCAILGDEIETPQELQSCQQPNS